MLFHFRSCRERSPSPASGGAGEKLRELEPLPFVQGTGDALVDVEGRKLGTGDSVRSGTAVVVIPLDGGPAH